MIPVSSSLATNVAHCTLTVKQEARQLVGKAKRRATKIRPKAVGSGIFGRFSNFGKGRPEVPGDVISGVAVD